jgi:hypothetical protein
MSSDEAYEESDEASSEDDASPAVDPSSSEEEPAKKRRAPPKKKKAAGPPPGGFCTGGAFRTERMPSAGPAMQRPKQTPAQLQTTGGSHLAHALQHDGWHYGVERARSSQSKCRLCNKKIQKGDLRIGIMVPLSDEYHNGAPTCAGLWYGANCLWRTMYLKKRANLRVDDLGGLSGAAELDAGGAAMLAVLIKDGPEWPAPHDPGARYLDLYEVELTTDGVAAAAAAAAAAATTAAAAATTAAAAASSKKHSRDGGAGASSSGKKPKVKVGVAAAEEEEDAFGDDFGGIDDAALCAAADAAIAAHNSQTEI